MTDTFSSNTDGPGFGHPSDPVPPAQESPQPAAPQSPAAGEGELTSTLTELEHKLRELEQELSSIETEPAIETVDTPDAQPVSLELPDVDEPALETPPFAFKAPTFEPAGSDSPASLSLPQTPIPDHASPIEEPVEETPAFTANEDSRLVDEALHPDVVEPEPAPVVAIPELLRFRERLERVTSELIDDYDQLVATLTEQHAAPEPTPAAHQPSLPTFEPDPQALPEPPTFSEPAQAPVDEPSIESPQEPTEEQIQFSGHVELGVGPFFDIGSLSAFEDQVASLPNVLETAVRRFEASHAVLDLHLSAPIALVGALRGVVETEFKVRQISDSRLAITFEDS